MVVHLVDAALILIGRHIIEHGTTVHMVVVGEAMRRLVHGCKATALPPIQSAVYARGRPGLADAYRKQLMAQLFPITVQLLRS